MLRSLSSVATHTRLEYPSQTLEAINITNAHPCENPLSQIISLDAHTRRAPTRSIDTWYTTSRFNSRFTSNSEIQISYPDISEYPTEHHKILPQPLISCPKHHIDTIIYFLWTPKLDLHFSNCNLGVSNFSIGIQENANTTKYADNSPNPFSTAQNPNKDTHTDPGVGCLIILYLLATTPNTCHGDIHPCHQVLPALTHSDPFPRSPTSLVSWFLTANLYAPLITALDKSLLSYILYPVLPHLGFEPSPISTQPTHNYFFFTSEIAPAPGKCYTTPDNSPLRKSINLIYSEPLMNSSRTSHHDCL